MLYAVYSLQACGAENGCRERISPYRAAEPRVTAVHVIALSAELRNSAGPGRAGSAAVPFSAGAHLQTVRDILAYDLFFPSKRNLFSYGWFCILSVRLYCRMSCCSGQYIRADKSTPGSRTKAHCFLRTMMYAAVIMHEVRIHETGNTIKRLSYV